MHDDPPLGAPTVHRLAAFTDVPSGGNPAGVVVTEEPIATASMQQIAAEVGYSETAFLTAPSHDRRRWQVRYFAPSSEVPFCGHATIAAAVLLSSEVGAGELTFDTPAGPVAIAVTVDATGVSATLTSVAPTVEVLPSSRLTPLLEAVGYAPAQLDTTYPAAIAAAGARHLVLVLRERTDLAALTYPFALLRAAMEREDLTTVMVAWPDPNGAWHARNAFPTGGVVEDPATGAAAAAFGAYLREVGHVTPPARFTILQGEDLGRPSRLLVHVPAPTGGVEVTGTAVAIRDRTSAWRHGG